MGSNPITKIHQERTALLDRKGHDYTANVNGVAVDNLKVVGLPGISVRVLDKATRLVALTLGGKDPQVVGETLRDTLLDLGNYADLGVLFVDGTYDKFRPASNGGNPSGDSNPDEEEDPGKEDEGEDNGSDEIVCDLVCFHSRNMYRVLEEGVKTVSLELWDNALCYNTGDFSSTFDGAWTPLAVIIAISDIVAKAKRVHVAWDGNDLFIPMVVGMAVANGIPVTCGRVDFPQGHPSRVHTLINSLPPLVE